MNRVFTESVPSFVAFGLWQNQRLKELLAADPETAAIYGDD